MQNGVRDMRPRPKRGDIVKTLNGEKYEILEPGMKYALCRPLAGGTNGLIKYGELFPATNEAQENLYEF